MFKFKCNNIYLEKMIKKISKIIGFNNKVIKKIRLFKYIISSAILYTPLNSSFKKH